MPRIDTTAREKWPAPRPGPDVPTTVADVAAAEGETGADPRRAAARAVLALLRWQYGEPEWPILNPLDALIEVLLSHRTADPQTWAAFLRLRQRFPDWQAAVDAPVPEIEAAIAGTTWPEQKAPRVQAVLRTILAERGSLDLDFLRTLPLGEASAWLQALPGVGPKSAACVLLFALHRPVLPVDTHVLRVSQRLGLIGPKTTADAAHTELLVLLHDPANAPDVLAFHRDMLLHGQRICTWRDPRCPACVIREWCAYFAAHPEQQAAAQAHGSQLPLSITDQRT